MPAVKDIVWGYYKEGSTPKHSKCFYITKGLFWQFSNHEKAHSRPKHLHVSTGRVPHGSA